MTHDFGNLSPAPQGTHERHDPPSTWRPLQQPLFRALWIATVASNIGTWMQNVGAAKPDSHTMPGKQEAAPRGVQ